MENVIKIIGSAILTIATFLFGDISIPLEVLMFCIVVDFISGMVKAYVVGDLNSHTGFKGIFKKVGYLVIVALAYQIDKLTGTEVIKTTVIYFFVVNEALSILENWGKIGLPIPPVLIDKIEQLKGKEEK